MIFPVGRNLFHNANLANHSYSSGGFSNPGDFGIGYRAMDGWAVGVANGSGNRDIDLQASAGHPNYKSWHNTRFRTTSTPTTVWSIRHRIEGRDAIEAAKAGCLSYQLPYKTDEFTNIKVRLGYASVANNFATVNNFHLVNHATVINNTWQDGVLRENIKIDPVQAINGIEIIIDADTPSEGANLHEIRFTQLMMNPGPQIQPFELRHFSETFGKMADKRFYQQLAWTSSVEYGWSSGGANHRQAWQVPVYPMRVAPTITKSWSGQNNIRANDPATYWGITSISSDHDLLRITQEAAAAGWTYVAEPKIFLSAEL